MDRGQFIPELENVLEIAPGMLREDQNVRDLEHWDSLKLLEVLALADEQLQVQVDADHLAKCVTIGDILNLLEESSGSKGAQQ
jgi:acyl carrier protein